MPDFSDQHPPGIKRRLWDMALGWGSVGVVYASTGFLNGPAALLPETAVDRWIAFNAVGIWWYVSFFILIPYAYLGVRPERLLWFRRSMQAAALLAGIVFWCWPTTMRYPEILGNDISTIALRWLLVVDTSQNCLPSLHAALTLLAVWALQDAKRPWRSALLLLWGAAIGFSIVQLRRHLSIDLVSGLLLGALVGAVLHAWGRQLSPTRSIFAWRGKEIL